ncbi:Txn [Lemmus lemmus]
MVKLIKRMEALQEALDAAGSKLVVSISQTGGLAERSAPFISPLRSIQRAILEVPVEDSQDIAANGELKHLLTFKSYTWVQRGWLFLELRRKT